MWSYQIQNIYSQQQQLIQFTDQIAAVCHWVNIECNQHFSNGYDQSKQGIISCPYMFASDANHLVRWFVKSDSGQNNNITIQIIAGSVTGYSGVLICGIVFTLDAIDNDVLTLDQIKF